MRENRGPFVGRPSCLSLNELLPILVRHGDHCDTTTAMWQKEETGAYEAAFVSVLPAFFLPHGASAATRPKPYVMIYADSHEATADCFNSIL